MLGGGGSLAQLERTHRHSNHSDRNERVRSWHIAEHRRGWCPRASCSSTGMKQSLARLSGIFGASSQGTRSLHPMSTAATGSNGRDQMCASRSRPRAVKRYSRRVRSSASRSTIFKAGGLRALGRTKRCNLSSDMEESLNREHPYRQLLERASGGRVKLLEKTDPFTRRR